VSTRILDLEEIDEPDGTYDVVLCRDGLMLAPDPVRAAREIRRVLRPGGRAAVAVWGPRARNPWLGVVFDVVGKHLGTTLPPPGVPNAFSLDDAERLARVLAGSGLADVSVEEVQVSQVVASADEWWQRSSSLAGSLVQLLAALPASDARALRARAVEAVSSYRTEAGLEFPGVALVAYGRSE
jgi:SAM-dependent methyltransferase